MSLQTDTCDTLYVTKNTLTAYTIAVVQNSQALQYDQMHAALQSARNQSSLETPLKAEELLSAHFNLADLEDQTITHTIPNAEKSSDNTQNAEPSTSAPDDQTYVKIPSRYTENSSTRRTHLTGAVTPTAEVTSVLSTRYLRAMNLTILGIICLTITNTHIHTT